MRGKIANLHRIAIGLVLASGLVACCAEKPSEAPMDLAGLEEIRIDYEYMGWSFADEHFTISPIPGQRDFLLQGLYETGRGRQVEIETPLPPEKVRVLLKALDSPAWPRNQGLHALAQKIDRAALRNMEQFDMSPSSRCTHEELRQLARLHIRRKHVVGLLDERYGHGISWTDDYPSALVQVRWRDRPGFMMSSRSQKAMMLPWSIGMPSDVPLSDENWSLPVSAALRALVPPASRLHERLDGMDRLQDQLGLGVMLEARRQCDAMRSEDRSPRD